MPFINSYESDNQKLNSTQVVAVFGKDNKFLKYEIGQTAVAAVQQELGRHYNKPHLDAPSAGEAIGYVAEEAWESNEVRPVLLAPIEAAGIGKLVGFLKGASAAKIGIKTVADLFDAGTKMKNVKAGGQISVKGNIDDVFNSLSKGGKTETLKGGRIKATLPDGNTVTRYPASSGSQTIQVNQGGKITKVRFE